MIFKNHPENTPVLDAKIHIDKNDPVVSRRGPTSHKYRKPLDNANMTSNINPSAINVNVPVANSDNPSQDLRDNFAQIKAQLAVAKAELSNLQNTTITLTGDIVASPVSLTQDPNGAMLVTGVKRTDLAYSFHVPGTGAITIPVGDTSQRPASAPLNPAKGMLRYNTDNDRMEYYNGNGWFSFVDTSTAIEFQNAQMDGLLNAAALLFYNIPYIRERSLDQYQSSHPSLGSNFDIVSRDLGELIACFMNDILLGGTANTVAAGKLVGPDLYDILNTNLTYVTDLLQGIVLPLVRDIVANIPVPPYTAPLNTSQVIKPEFPGGTQAYAGFASNLNLFLLVTQDVVTSGHVYDTAYYNVVLGATGQQSAQMLIYKNLDFFSSEIVGWINTNNPGFLASIVDSQNNSIGQSYCYRDVQLILNCILSDILTGISINATLAGNKYWNANKTVIPNQVALTVAAMEYLKTLVESVLSNTAVGTSYQTPAFYIPQFIDAISYPDGSNLYPDVVTRINIIENIIQTAPSPIPGPMQGPPGPQGPQGPTGPSAGPTGPTGPAGVGIGLPGGPNQSIQYNNEGQLEGDPGLLYDGSQLIANQAQVGQVKLYDNVVTNLLSQGVLNVNAKGQLSSVIVNNPGGGYTTVPAITVDPPPPGGIQASVQARMGAVDATPYNRGINYNVGDILTVYGGVFSQSTLLTVDRVRIGTAVVDPNNKGVGYKPGDILTVTGGIYSFPATIVVTRVSLRDPSVILSGYGYVTGDIVEVFGGAGSPAQYVVTADPIVIQNIYNQFTGSTNTTLTLSSLVDPLDYASVVVFKNTSRLVYNTDYTFGTTVVNGETVTTVLLVAAPHVSDTMSVLLNAFIGTGFSSQFVLSRNIYVGQIDQLVVTVNSKTMTLDTDYVIVNNNTISFIKAPPATGAIIKASLGGRVLSVTPNVINTVAQIGDYREVPNLLANTMIGGTGTGLIMEFQTQIQEVILQNQGPYEQLPQMNLNVVTGGSGTRALFNLTSEINTLVITNPGSYRFLPPLIENAVTGGSGTGAGINLSYGVIGADVQNAGAGYTDSPKITVDVSPIRNTARLRAQMSGAKVTIGDLIVTGSAVGTAPVVTNVIYVTQDGDDSNDGLSEDRAKRTIKAACAIAKAYSTIFVRAGNYYENNPIYVPERVAIIGDNLRRVNLYYNNPTKDFFWVNNACYIAGVSFRGGKTPGYAIAFPPITDPDLPPGVPGGAGQITTSPYVQNCTCFNTTGGGMLVDGNRARGLRSMVLDAFTQFNQGGPGIHITNLGYAQLVSIFTICCSIGTWVTNGGFCTVSNSNTSFGDIGILADGISPFLYGGKIKTGTGIVKSDTITVDNLTQRPYVGLVATIGPEFNYISDFTVVDAGSGYVDPNISPITVVIDPPLGYTGTQATASAITASNGSISSIVILNPGSNYTSSAYATIYDPTGSGAIINQIIFWTPVSGNSLTGLTITNGGAGYKNGDLIFVQGGSYPDPTFDSPLAMVVSSVDSTGAVLSVSAQLYDIAGSLKPYNRYNVLPQVSGAPTTTTGFGQGFTCRINFQIYDIQLDSTQTGSGYYQPQLTISGGGANTAKATVNYDPSTGSISSLNLISQGAGYLIQPQIVIAGGGGIGATAVSRVTNGVVTEIRITNPGQNYNTNPTVYFSGGEGNGAQAGLVHWTVVYASVSSVNDVNATYNNFTYGGTGYKVGDLLTLNSGVTSNPCRLYVTQVDSYGSVLEVSLDQGGDYTVMPTSVACPTTVASGLGTGCLIDLSLGIGAIDVASGGSGYTSGPRIRILGSGAESLVFQSSKTYYNSLGTTLYSNQGDALASAIEHAGTVAASVVINQPLGSPLQHTVSQFIDSGITVPSGVQPLLVQASNSLFELAASFVKFTNPTPSNPNYFGITEGPFDNIESIIRQNKAFIQAEIVAYIQTQSWSPAPPVDICYRDVGYMVDAIALDSRTGGFLRSIRAGRAYWNGTAQVFLNGGENTHTLSVLDQIGTLLTSIISNTVIASPYQTFVPQVVTDLYGYQRVQDNITACINVMKYIIKASSFGSADSNGPTLVDYNNSANLLKKNIYFIQAETNQYISNNSGSYTLNTQQLDEFLTALSTIIDAVAGDFTGLGGTPAIVRANLYPVYYTVQSSTPLVPTGSSLIPPMYSAEVNQSLSVLAGASYFQATGSNLLPGNEIVPTQNAIGYLSAWAQNLVQNITTPPAGYSGSPYQSAVTPVANGSLTGGSITTSMISHLAGVISGIIGSSSVSTALAGFTNSANIVLNNIPALQTAVSTYVTTNYPGLLTPTQLSTCVRDVGTICDEIYRDLIAGSFAHSFKAGLAYWNGNRSQISSGTVSATTASLTYLGTQINALLTDAPSKAWVTSCINIMNSIISSASPSSIMADYTNARELLILNRNFLQTEVGAYVKTLITLNSNQQSLCQRDVGFMVDAIAGDIVGAGAYPIGDKIQAETSITFEEITDYAPLDNEQVNLYQVSVCSTGNHTFEFVGAGTDINTCLPQLGGVPIQANECVQTNGGRVYYTSTDHKGDFRIGSGLVINQNTGTLSGRVFAKSLFGLITPFVLSIESAG